ncbi:hypothetical protein BB8028_0001g05410 [Beauveria bassiana]|uniref:Uncharacterized protein n=1 Tax=Beauveria bassiana TaxID=176275 RepID=A0A2S7XX30_BEABA|nr:hypothetical protein BB8028_0001g05410 [Beauveria bassiana]
MSPPTHHAVCVVFSRTVAPRPAIHNQAWQARILLAFLPASHGHCKYQLWLQLHRQGPPQKDTQKHRATSWPGFRRAAVPGRFSTAIALPHTTYLSASQRHHGCGASRLTRVESEMNFFIAASSYHEKRVCHSARSILGTITHAVMFTIFVLRSSMMLTRRNWCHHNPGQRNQRQGLTAQARRSIWFRAS